jgi:small subunit ribosomal protein S15
MTATTEQRKEIVTKFQTHPTDTGSAEVQIALMTERINSLTEHFKIHKKDFAGRRGLLAIVSNRRSLLDYVRRQNEGRYSKLIAALNIRK